MKQSILFSLLPALVVAGPGINPNPDPNFDPSTSQGTFGPFIPAQKAAVSATGGPTGNIDARTKQAMQLAISNWQTDTGIVSGFQNVGQSTTDNAAFMGIADGAFKAEVDELSQKAVLDQVIGNDPRVSIANLTLTNGVFQSVVDNLQIMSLQGQSKQNLIDSINSVRCVQILPSIDTYMLVAAEYIGDNVQQRRAVRPTACGDILAQAASNSSAFPNVPGTPNGTPQGKGDGIVNGVPNACQMGAGSLGTSGQANTTSNGNSNGGSKGNTNTGKNGNGKAGSGSSAPVLPPLNNTTTPQLGLPGFSGSSSSGTSTGTSSTGTANSGNNGAKKGGNQNQGTVSSPASTSTARAGNTGAQQGGKKAPQQSAAAGAGANNGANGGATGINGKKFPFPFHS